MAHGKPEAGTVRMPLSLYLNGALLYYHHLCQKGRDKIVEGDLTSKAAEGYAARITFQRAKEEGLDVAIHWQDADSSSTREIFPKAEIMLCGGHAGRAHRKILEKRQKDKTLPLKHVDNKEGCKCVGYHRSGCGCLSDTFISKAHTNFTSIAQPQDEFVRRVKALPRHAVDDHSQCDYHPLVVCSCGACENKDQISCQGKPSIVNSMLCSSVMREPSRYPVLKRGHSNAVEAFPITLERLHYHASTNLALLQANMHAKFGIRIPDFYRRMKLPVFDGVQEALEKHNMQHKRKLERE